MPSPPDEWTGNTLALFAWWVSRETTAVCSARAVEIRYDLHNVGLLVLHQFRIDGER